jgi:hypothetical protein
MNKDNDSTLEESLDMQNSSLHSVSKNKQEKKNIMNQTSMASSELESDGEEDEQLLQYRKEKYLKMKTEANNFILKPFLIGMSVAVGMSFGK